VALAPGTRIGPYDILGTLGAGGMGEVYRARDTQLKRDVAVKVLPDAFAEDPERLARFQREAEILAAINHPNIAAIYGLETSGATRALILELVEGPTLAELIAGASKDAPPPEGRGGSSEPPAGESKDSPLPIQEALDIARQVADALEAAHEQGVVHRDLKPSNIKVRPDGAVKVLDFGLAKALDGPAGHDLQPTGSASPTITSPAMTRMGVILGTAAYMSPEQAKGQTADRRSDLWAFGCVLYEMLTGRRAFPGEDLTDTLAAVIMREPDWAALPPDTPPPVRRLLRRCLRRDRRARLADASTARIEIDEARSQPDAELRPSSQAVGRRERRLWGSAVGLLALLALAALVWALGPAAGEAPEMRLQVETPFTTAPLQFALSPDGRHLVFVASGDGQQRLWLRALDTVEPTPLAGTEGATYPFWSADSRSVGFFASNKLYRIDISGGPPQALTSVPFLRGGAWSADGTILLAQTDLSELSRIPVTGGKPIAVTRLDPPHHTGHRFPRFLPDGRRFLFYAAGDPDSAGIYLGSLDGGEPTRLTAAESAGAYLPPGWLLFVRQGTLVARRLDVDRGELTGDPVTVADRVGYDTAASGGFSVSAGGQIAYRSAAAGSGALRWFDRSGKLLGLAGEPDAGDLLNPELSPDGRRVALARTVQSVGNVWLMDLARKGFSRFTFDASSNFAVWSPDGQQIAFQSTRNSINVYVKPTSGMGAETLVLDTPNIKVPQDWSPDGRFLLYYELDPKTNRDVWALPMTGADKKARVVANTRFDERHGQFSPDGRFVAYTTDESGRPEVVVQNFPEATGRWPVSTGGGIQPRWRADGGEIYFIAPDGMLMAASVRVPGLGPGLDIGTPVALFPSRIVALGGTANFRPQYDVSRDGRFLIIQPTEESAASPITILLNWKPPDGR
jgi:serine/threonine protein kinase/Tol biopolymer transport system component